ncbi:MAG: YybH family protein [Gammaproteobacteria bacterium]
MRSLVAQWHSATAVGDVETVLGLMAEDVVLLVSGQPPMKRCSTFEKGLPGLLTSHRLESTGDIQEVYVSGDLGFWSVLTVRIIPLSGGNAVVRKGSALSILRKQANGEWVVVRDANMLSVAS